MKPSFSILFLLIINISNAQPTFLITGGYSEVKFHAYKQSNSIEYWNNYGTGYTWGWQVGATCQLPINKKLVQEYGLQLRSVGTNLYYPYNSEKVDIQLIYVTLPAKIGYTWNLTNHLKGLVGGGIYLAYAVWGTETGKGKEHINGSNYVINNKVLFKNNDPNQVLPVTINPFDYGLNLFTGVEEKRLRVSAEFTSGLRNTVPNPAVYGRSFRNQSFSINVGYFLVKRIELNEK